MNSHVQEKLLDIRPSRLLCKFILCMLDTSIHVSE